MRRVKRRERMIRKGERYGERIAFRVWTGGMAKKWVSWIVRRLSFKVHIERASEPYLTQPRLINLFSRLYVWC